MRRAVALAAALLVPLFLGRPLRAAMSGAEVYGDACASCHGRDGRGSPQGSAIVVPLPDFTDCVTATAETTANWEGLVRNGSRFLGLSDQMPAYGQALDDDEISAVVAYVRRFCTDPRYPVGDLNFARPLFIEKAYPEDEIVASFERETAATARTAAVEAALEKRVGARGQFEASLPASIVDPDGGVTASGVGDVGLSYKHAILADAERRTIATTRLAVSLPTGKTANGIGAGTTVFNPQFLAAHAAGPFVAQAQISAEVPTDIDRASRQMVYGLALQWRLGPYKKDAVVGLECQQTQALVSDVQAATVLGPTVYLPLSRRGHVAFAVGAQLPVAGARPYDWLLGSFLLWDFADGPFWAW